VFLLVQIILSSAEPTSLPVLSYPMLQEEKECSRQSYMLFNIQFLLMVKLQERRRIFFRSKVKPKGQELKSSDGGETRVNPVSPFTR
jgi:hypothetical protein